MTFPNNCQCQFEGYRYSASYESHSATTVAQRNEAGNVNTLSVSLSSSWSYSETRYVPSSPEPEQIYHQPKAPSTHEQADSSSNNTRETSAVLALIEQRLVADAEAGLNKEDMQNSFQAGYDGFVQGYNDAVSLLESMGLFEGEVKDAVEQMLKKVITGFAELAEKFDLVNPNSPATQANAPIEENVVETVVDSNPTIAPQAIFSNFAARTTQINNAELLSTLIEPNQSVYSKVDAEESSSRFYNFNLRTADGDVVTIRSYADEGSRYQKDSSANGSTEQFDVAGMEDFRFSVQGDLDADELSAITDLLSQVNDVAETFFDGDIYSAYEQALSVGYDSDEIARFSLNLRQVDYSRLENSYGSVARADTDSFRLIGREQQSDSSPMELMHPVFQNNASKISEFVRIIEQVREQGERFNFRAEQLESFASFVGKHRFGHHPHTPHFSPLVGSMAAALQQQHA